MPAHLQGVLPARIWSGHTSISVQKLCSSQGRRVHQEKKDGDEYIQNEEK